MARTRRNRWGVSTPHTSQAVQDCVRKATVDAVARIFVDRHARNFARARDIADLRAERKVSVEMEWVTNVLNEIANDPSYAYIDTAGVCRYSQDVTKAIDRYRFADRERVLDKEMIFEFAQARADMVVPKVGHFLCSLYDAYGSTADEQCLKGRTTEEREEYELYRLTPYHYGASSWINDLYNPQRSVGTKDALFRPPPSWTLLYGPRREYVSSGEDHAIRWLPSQRLPSADASYRHRRCSLPNTAWLMYFLSLKDLKTPWGQTFYMAPREQPPCSESKKRQRDDSEPDRERVDVLMRESQS